MSFVKIGKYAINMSKVISITQKTPVNSKDMVSNCSFIDIRYVDRTHIRFYEDKCPDEYKDIKDFYKTIMSRVRLVKIH
jgi:hypothetical protein